jgi:hypothetical protein
MAKNIIEAVQEKLGYAPLQKVDPNQQDTNFGESSTSQKLAQAAIPAVLTAIYKLTRTDDGCNAILHATAGSDTLANIYHGKEHQAAAKVAQYAGVETNEALHQMKNVSEETTNILKEIAGKEEGPQKLKTYMNTQRHNILVYLPAKLDMGDLLDDETLDDRTNKMEGPVSSFMHKVENTLSSGGKK